MYSQIKLNKLQQKLFQVFPIQKNVLYNILKVLRNPRRYIKASIKEKKTKQKQQKTKQKQHFFNVVRYIMIIPVIY